jgi:Ricin-type beta-trefoil lectin domain/Lysozyme like domain
MRRTAALTRIAILLTLATAGAAGVTIVAPALASSPRQATAGRHGPASPSGPQALRRPAASPLTVSAGLVAPSAVQGRLSTAATGQAVSTCVYYAARAGWPDNGYYGGDLVTAAAICVAESAGNPDLIVCDNASGGITGQGNYPKFTCPKGTTSYDRGLWQLNTIGARGVSNKCAFDPVCNAGQSYLDSGRGTSFAAWSSYDTDTYAGPFLDLVQAAVLKLRTGTVTSALLGECLAADRPVIGAKVVVANCGTGAGGQLWSFTGGKLRSGSLCAAAGSGRQALLVLARCGRGRTQDWAVAGRYELRNAGTGKCLTDPGSSLTAGTQVNVTRCANAKDQTWWAA